MIVLEALPQSLRDRLLTDDESVEAGGRFLLDDPGYVYFVTEGSVELYAVSVVEGGQPIDRRFLLARGRGELLWGVGIRRTEDAPPVSILAVPASGTRLLKTKARRFLGMAREADQHEPIAKLIESWISSLSRGLSGGLRARKQDLTLTASWRRDPAVAILDDFHGSLLSTLAERRKEERDEDLERRKLRATSDRARTQRALGSLASVLDEADAEAADLTGSPLVRAMRAVLATLDVPLSAVPEAFEKERDPVRALARHAGVRARTVALRGLFFRGDHGPLLAFRREGRAPVALLPTRGGRYTLVDGTTGVEQPLGSQLAATLEPFAHTFYRRLPSRSLGVKDLVLFGIQGVRRDLATVLAMGAAAGFLALVPPLASVLIFDTVIPGASKSSLVQVSLGLLLAAVTQALFGITRSYATLRAEGRAGVSLQAAVWDRLLDLPAGFFRRFAAGDLAMRAYGVDAIQKSLSAGVIGTLLSGFFGVFNAALLFRYDARLGAIASLLVAAAVAVTLVSGLRQIELQRPLAALRGRIQGLVLQLIGGIAKLRIAGAERRAFSRWAELFAEQRRLTLRARAPLQVFQSVYPIVASMVIYGAVVGAKGPTLTAGTLIAFVAAFQLYLGSTLSVCQAVLGMLELGPTYERLLPILTTPPEIDAGKTDPGTLRGEIEVGHVSFRYGDAGPLVLEETSLRIRPGEFVAIVGASGSGKSTLLRLLLGFEQPTAGTVSYDGQDLLGLDLRAVRRQIGVVLQDGRLFTGDILSNILGASNLGLEEALDAARKAGLSRDLEKMPMGIHTVVSEGGSTLSGGQRQRLMIARAIVRRPRLLFLDEATSALDNETQAAVTSGIESLEATRVVIAHRLSTILKADRIFVFERGRLVQEGTYEQLVAVPGPFADLARRQVA